MKMLNKVLAALAMGLVVLAFAPRVVAQQPTDQASAASVEKIEITGSAIRRIESEGALPVTVISRDAIDKSGVTTVTDLIQNLPEMTGGNFQMSSNSVNGNGNGATTAAIHGLDEKYTLVLLNGKRIAPYGGFGNGAVADGSVNLESIPLDAIERVEVLKDGASALYGSDAIAGVINFITRKNATDGAAFFNMSQPRQSGGSTWSAGISKGFGDLAKDGYNVLATYSHDYQEKLEASQRDVSKRGGYVPFSSGGTNYLLYMTSINSLPANISLDQSGATFSPYFNANGNCTGNPVLFVHNGYCRTNYAATVEDIPGSSRDSVFLDGRLKINPGMTAFAEAVYSKFDMKAQFAPPAQPMGLGTNDLPGQPLNILWQKYVVPYLAANNDPSTSGTLDYRAFDAGGRTDDWVTTARHLVLGLEGAFSGWDYSASIVASTNEDKDNLAGGYVDFNKLVALIASGQYDPVIPVPGQSLQSAVLGGTFIRTTMTQNMLTMHASRELFQLPGGPGSLGVGADYTKQHIREEPNALAQFGNATPGQQGNVDYAVGGFYGFMPLDASRNNWGAFAEMLMPVVKSVEVTASLRYDSYDKVHNASPFTQPYDPTTGLLYPLPAQDQGNSINATTFKLSFRALPVESVLLRGSYGSGIKAPTIPQIANPLFFASNTVGSYACPFPGTLACNALPNGQYDLLADGNPASGSAGLKAETSRQWTFGGRLEAMKGFSVGIDLWAIKMNHQILAGVPEAFAFNNPALVPDAFISNYRDPSGPITVALKQIPFNAGHSETEGLDWNFDFRRQTSIGNLTVDLSGTHMIKQRFQLLEGGPWYTDLGVFGPDNNVVFRNTMRLVLSVQTGAFTNTLSMSYKSGYQDESYTADSATVRLQNPDGTPGAPVDFAGLDVSSYKLFDWQTRYQLNKSWRFTLGINNIFNTAPPFSLKTVAGNQVGYDSRYADPTGRAFTAGALFRF